MASKLLLIGWDAADWRVADPLIAQGAMPNLARLIQGGVRGNIRTLYPMLSPMLWTSIATGKRPQKHGIHGFTEVCSETGAVRPVSGRSRETKALWNILGQNNMQSNVIGWWPSHPVEPIRGAMVSNFFQHVTSTRADMGGQLPKGTAHPERLLTELAPLRIHPDEFNENHLLPFMPSLLKMNWKKDKRVHTCAKMLAECSSIHSAATGIMQLEPWDFMGVYYDAIDHFSHAFMKYHPPRRKNVSEEDFENYKEVVNAAYRYHDLMLGTLLQLAGEDTTIMLISDHGFHPDHLRPDSIPDEPAGPASEHRAQGIFVASGPNIEKGKTVGGISLLDVAPTILHHYGLAVGEDMDGKVIENIFVNKTSPASVISWDQIEGEDGSYSATSSMSFEETKAALDQLVELGYIDKPDERIETAREETLRELDYNLARSYMDAQHFTEGAALLKSLWGRYPTEYRFAMQLLTCLERMQRKEDAAELIQAIIQSKEEYAKQNKEALSAQFKALQERIKQGEVILPNEITKVRKDIGRLSFNPETNVQLSIRSAMLREAFEEAEKLAETALEEFPKNINLLLIYARLRTRKEHWDEAVQLYARILEIEPLEESAFIGLAYANLSQKEFWQAAANAQQAVQLAPKNPWAHYYSGCALLRLSKPKLGLLALNQAVELNSNFVDAWDRLARYYSRAKKRPGSEKKANYCRERAKVARVALTADCVEPSKDSSLAEGLEADIARLEENLSSLVSKFRANECSAPSASVHEVVTIVTGLPRSGSSLMMQMLAAGGIAPLTDGVREADENNPRGFFEYEPVKKGKNFQDWMPQASGRAVKIVAPLLSAIPRNYKYRIVMCHRPLEQMLTSQAKMLQRIDKDNAKLDRPLRRTYLRQMNRVLTFLQKNDIPVILMEYTETVDAPVESAERLNHFFNEELDVDAMAAVIDPSLHRER
ncbi:MAG: alkaline phosphatase family protein [Lentimonas sp.]